MIRCTQLLVVNIILAINIRNSWQWPETLQNAKASYKSGEFAPQPPITLARIKDKLRDSGVFYDDGTLDDNERRQLNNLFDAVEIMTTSRNRQPAPTNMYTALRTVERAVKKLLKEGQISDELANKFHWDKIFARPSTSANDVDESSEREAT